jgi:hypothetical protein
MTRVDFGWRGEMTVWGDDCKKSVTRFVLVLREVTPARAEEAPARAGMVFRGRLRFSASGCGSISRRSGMTRYLR